MTRNYNDYILYSGKKDTIFLDSSSNLKLDEFTIANHDRNEWDTFKDAYWNYMIYKNKDFPEQGWKIHITTAINDSEKMLFDVSLFLIKNRISFKYVPNKNALIRKNSKYANRSSSGKFITVYPYDEKNFIALLDELKKITDRYEDGPYILNDKQWKMSNVFFRYGGMKNLISFNKGKRILSIRNPKGNLVPDMRVPYYFLPNFVKEPFQIEKNNILPEEKQFEKLNEIKIIKALHHSNAGGVYLVEKDNKYCILKEGRRGAGLDANIKDGYERIKDEYYFLRLLSNITGVIDVYEKFSIWNNNYFIEEYFEGISLRQFIAKNYPLSIYIDANTKDNYLNKIEIIISRLSKIISEIHRAGIGIGDLSLNNILINEQSLEVKIIDFEAANFLYNKYIPSLSTPGFTDDNSINYYDNDIFAKNRIFRSLFLPLTHLLDLSSDLADNHDETIEKIFGKKGTYLLEKHNIDSNYKTGKFSPIYFNSPLLVPKAPISINNLNEILYRFFTGLKDNLDFDTFSLFPGNIEQNFDIADKYNIEYGSFGVLLSILRLNSHDKNLNETLTTWIKSIVPYIRHLYFSEKIPIGLFNGIGGIITVLYESQNHRIMQELVELISKDVKMTIDDNSDVSVYSGLSGIGLLFLSLYDIYENSEYLSLVELISEKIQLIYSEDVDKKLHDFGFINGWSGAALFLLKYGKMINSEEIISIAINIIDDFLLFIDEDPDYEKLFKNTKESTYIINPYLKEGLSGILLVFLEMVKDNDEFFTADREFKFNKLAHHALLHISADIGLFKGYIGVSLFINAYSTIFGKNELLESVISNLNNYIVSDNIDNCYIPGPYGIKISLNYSNGSSGLLLVLRDLNQNRWNSWLPLPITNLKIFKY